MVKNKSPLGNSNLPLANQSPLGNSSPLGKYTCRLKLSLLSHIAIHKDQSPKISIIMHISIHIYVAVILLHEYHLYRNPPDLNNNILFIFRYYYLLIAFNLCIVFEISYKTLYQWNDTK